MSASILNNKDQNLSFDNKIAILNEVSDLNSSQSNENSKRKGNETTGKDFMNSAHLGHFQFVAGIILTAAADRRGHIVTIPVPLMQ